MTAAYSLDLGWIDRARARFALWRDRRRAARTLSGRVGVLDSGELVIVDAAGRARVIDLDTTRTIDDMLWGSTVAMAADRARGAAASPEGRPPVQ